MAISYKKVEMVLNFRKDKTKVYKIAQQTLPAVTSNQLIEEVANSCSVNKTMSRAVIEAMINRLCHYMELGHAVQVGEFGTFKPTITVKTQKDAKDLSVKDVKRKKIRFYPGKRFKELMSSMSVTEMEINGNLVENGETGTVTPVDPNPGSGGSSDGGDDNAGL